MKVFRLLDRVSSEKKSIPVFIYFDKDCLGYPGTVYQPVILISNL
jgi:hypothetical protein